jgi:hypothetical protein
MAEPWLSEFVPWIAGVECRPSATADGTESLVIAEQVTVNGTMRVESRPSATADGTESLVIAEQVTVNGTMRVGSRPSATADSTE